MDFNMDHHNNVYDVAIVGGGVAGTYTAYRLRHMGQRIGLFESSNRIGGRLWTYNLPCSPTLNLELGGMRFKPKCHTELYKLVGQLGLHSVPFPMAGLDGNTNTVYYLRGKHLSEEDIRHGDVPYVLTKEEKENQHRLWYFYLEKLLGEKKPGRGDGDVLSRLKDPELKTRDGTLLYMLTLEEALNKVASPDGKTFALDRNINFSRWLYPHCVNARSAFLLVLNYEASGQFATLEESMSALPQRLKEAFETSSHKHTVMLQSRLVAMSRTEEGLYSLHFQYDSNKDTDGAFGVKASTAKLNIIRIMARRVIMAIPFSAIDKINWPPLNHIPFQRTRRLQSCVCLCKVYLVFPSPWWYASGRKCPHAYSDQTHCISMTFGHTDTAHALMAAYSNCHETAVLRTLQGMGSPITGSAPGDLRVSTPLKDFLLGELSKSFEVPRRTIPEPIGGVAAFWGDKIGGAVAFWKPGCLDERILNNLTRVREDEDVFVVSANLAQIFGCEVWVEGALRVVDSVLVKNGFVPSKAKY